MNILEVCDLHKRYGSQAALQGVSFAVAAGERFGLLGPNGAGKTTLLSILSSLLEPSSGEVRLRGELLWGAHANGRCAGSVDHGRTARSDLRRLVGIVPQDLALYGELTVRENLAFFGGIYGLAGAALTDRVAGVMRRTELADVADRRVEVLPWGSKRRLNLAAALVHEPRLLLLDEPTTGVDPHSRERIFDEVRRLNAEGVTIVYTSHYMEEVQALCPRIGIVDHGRLVACDALPALLRTLRGHISFRVLDLSVDLRRRIAAIPDARLLDDAGGETHELECGEVRPTLLKLIALLKENSVTMTGLEMQEPNLERVFLSLTGHALRD